MVQADIKVSFMAPQNIYESRATKLQFAGKLHPSGRDADVTNAWVRRPR